MSRVNVPFVGGAYAGRSTNQNPQECVNFFLETDQEGGKTPIGLYGTPGLKTWKDTATDAEIRGAIVCAGKLYVVAGADLLQITTALVMTDLGNLNTSTGPVRMIENGLQVMVVDDEDGYVYTISTATFSQVADADFPASVRGLTEQDSYGIVTQKGTDNFYISTAEDFTAWDALDYSSADGAPDFILATLSDHRELWHFKETSTEVWYNSGNADFPFERVQGAFLEKGIAGPSAYAKLDNSVYWLTNEGVMVRAEGYNPQVVSTRQIEWQWRNYTISDAICFAYHWQGHAFLQITFPTDGYTWVYDASNGAWHRRTSYPSNGRHRANCYAYFDGKHLVGDFENGIIYEIDDATYTDNAETITRWRTAPVITDKEVNLFHHSLQIDFEAGTGLVSGQGSDPQAMLQWSNDSGHTWSSETWVSTGGYTGAYAARAMFRRLGYARNRVYKVTVTDPVKWNILGATAEVTAGQY
jgi:hypothetical protein